MASKEVVLYPSNIDTVQSSGRQILCVPYFQGVNRSRGGDVDAIHRIALSRDYTVLATNRGIVSPEGDWKKWQSHAIEVSSVVVVHIDLYDPNWSTFEGFQEPMELLRSGIPSKTKVVLWVEDIEIEGMYSFACKRQRDSMVQKIREEFPSIVIIDDVKQLIAEI
jgi:hypothetical protein